ncbi:FUSC family membrane protein [Maribellus maritimus]|uniref:FUSC family membrane protein n=1 Tax=Maribellus maritimus TaxID=2870838 RepID=UPI001EEBDEE8|nr:FUSC family membrane protein [Maribellus maritimus]MCG6186383.1 FUSC family protein [Maribellus maritimus]
MSKEKFQYLQLNIKKFQQDFWRRPRRLNALRATASMGILAIPFIVAGKPFYGVTLALGALAGALSETNDHPKGRIKALSITIVSFFISSFSVGLLNNYTWLLGAGFVLSTIVFILIGGIGERYRAITFGSVLVGIYAMLGIEISPAWYWQAVLLPLGALFHGAFTLILLYQNPWRLLDEQMAVGFEQLANYLEKKAMLFPSKKQEQESINKDLALLNINVVNTLEKIKEVLNNYGRELENQEPLRPYLQRFMLLQSLHERAASSHERHDKLSDEEERLEVMEGFGEMLRQLAFASRKVAENMLTGVEYHHPKALEWISDAIEIKLKEMDASIAQPLVLLHHNLYRSHISLKYLDDIIQGTSIPRLRKDERSPIERFRRQLNFSHPRMRYALRLSLSFMVGFILERSLSLDKGAWVMLTSLFVSQITYSDTRRRLFQRLLGTVTGVIFGALLLHIFTSVASQAILMMASALAFFYWLRTKYSIAVIFITTFVISAFNLISKDAGLHIMLPRLIDTLLGATLSFLTIRFLWPGWQYRRMPELISKAMQKNMAYLEAIVSEYKETSVDDLAYRIARREAHLADNELAVAWNSMRQEPRSKRKLMQHALTLTYLNHALLSHISALGAHRETNMPVIENISVITNQINEVLNEASKYLVSQKNIIPTELSPVLMELKEQIVLSDNHLKKQQLRLFYNIAGTSSKIMKEIEETWVDIKN